MAKSNKEHLTWIYNRLKNVHQENPNYDYMQQFKNIIDDVAAKVDSNLNMNNIFNKVRNIYTEEFVTLQSMEHDIEEYDVDMSNVITAFVRIMFGECLDTLVNCRLYVCKDFIKVDGELMYTNPSPERIVATLICVSTESNNILNYVKSR